MSPTEFSLPSKVRLAFNLCGIAFTYGLHAPLSSLKSVVEAEEGGERREGGGEKEGRKELDCKEGRRLAKSVVVVGRYHIRTNRFLRCVQ